MKKHFILLLMSTILAITTACSSQNDEPVASSQPRTENSKTLKNTDSIISANYTRGNGLTTKLDDKTVEVVKADLIGAIEGAIKALDYAMDQDMNQEEAIGLIVISAVVHGAARSHQAEINYHAVDYPYILCSSSSTGNTAVSPTLSKDIVRVSESEEVTQNNWLRSYSTDAELASKYPNAVSVAKKHNAILSVINEKKGFNGFNSFESVLANLPTVQSDYLRSATYHNSLNKTVSNPTDFSSYTCIDLADPHYRMKSKINNFLSLMDRNG